MAISIVQLGTPRLPGEGLRIGTVRRPPRGVSKDRYARENWYDVWYPELSPRPALMAQAKTSESETEWKMFVRKFRAQLNEVASSRTLDMLSALSHCANFSIGCYCEQEDRCHRSVLRAVLKERGAKVI
jgi:uncharacterized protein YeaO (DUF488 family)